MSFCASNTIKVELEGFMSNFGKALKSSLNGRLVSDNSFHVYDKQELYKMIN